MNLPEGPVLRAERLRVGLQQQDQERLGLLRRRKSHDGGRQQRPADGRLRDLQWDAVDLQGADAVLHRQPVDAHFRREGGCQFLEFHGLPLLKGGRV